MEYILTMIVDESVWEGMTPEQAQAFDERITASTTLSGAPGPGSPTVTHGPHTDAVEQLAGFWIIEAGGIEDAVEWARKAPMDGGAIEVRQLVGEGEDA